MLKVDLISSSYDDVQVLWDVSLDVEEGELVTLIGNNGAGKTTTLRNIMGWLTPTEGDIQFKGRSIIGTPVDKRAELGLKIAPEDEGVFPDMSVIDNLKLGAYGASKDTKEDRLSRVFDLFPRLEERQGQYASTLSGGERQMLNISIALMQDPDLLLIDEPSIGLAPMLATELLEEIESINDQGTTIMLVEQNVNKALEIADRAYIIENGRITSEGDADTILNSDEIMKAYMGK
ncbi:ABC transporter ATP-binding protein [Natrinema sp. 1APR25-10V2]|uniref:ABC transporter ATP-binding protein n=1 Tax=Natrinema sp. 1APR25-10V2 TaxID=2951081 RepID=UPI0028770034|nr:ABC transporter ATP-binding protein [Natrinema sp. 1APR25-10V2]MDS0476953.1 ABC transporter ATP-binding protein [Natrinema sp. 1APR25-10V2]